MLTFDVGIWKAGSSGLLGTVSTSRSVVMRSPCLAVLTVECSSKVSLEPETCKDSNHSGTPPAPDTMRTATGKRHTTENTS